MASKLQLEQYIVLPPRGLRVASTTGNPGLRSFLQSFPSADGVAKAVAFAPPESPELKMRVLDAIAEDGAKLVEMPPERITELRANQPGLRILPVQYYRSARVPRPIPRSRPTVASTAVTTRLLLKVVSNGQPVQGANVIAFTDFAQRIGVEGETNRRGEVRFSLRANTVLDRLYVYPPPGFWGFLKQRIAVVSGMQIDLRPIDFTANDALRHFYGNAEDAVGNGLRVGVIDTGVGPHGDLVVAGGRNTVLGETETDFGDNGSGHGTHVAGIIASRGLAPTGMRGVAPGVTLHSYRVFGKDDPEASNFAIAKAIDRAVQDGCDLINMSISGGGADVAIEGAITDARARGSLVLVAAGNDDRSPVGFPASASLSLAISAMGRKGTFPPDATQSGTIADPFGRPDRNNFIAAFSNIGAEIKLTAPGVGIVSTVPGGYSPDDGTSMACPAATGIAARLIAGQPAILRMNRTSARSDAMARLVLQSARSLGFGPTFEGLGIL